MLLLVLILILSNSCKAQYLSHGNMLGSDAFVPMPNKALCET